MVITQFRKKVQIPPLFLVGQYRYIDRNNKYIVRYITGWSISISAQAVTKYVHFQMCAEPKKACPLKGVSATLGELFWSFSFRILFLHFASSIKWCGFLQCLQYVSIIFCLPLFLPNSLLTVFSGLLSIGFHFMTFLTKGDLSFVYARTILIPMLLCTLLCLLPPYGVLFPVRHSFSCTFFWS